MATYDTLPTAALEYYKRMIAGTASGGGIGASGPASSVEKAETTVTPAAVTLVASTANTLLAANTSRIRFTIINPLATPLYVRKAVVATAATAAAGGYDFVVGPGQQYQSEAGEYAGALNGICATAGNVGVSESV